MAEHVAQEAGGVPELHLAERPGKEVHELGMALVLALSAERAGSDTALVDEEEQRIFLRVALGRRVEMARLLGCALRWHLSKLDRPDSVEGEVGTC